MGLEKEFAFKQSDFKILSEIVYDKTGIVLKDHKFEMVYGRLARRLRQLSLRRFSDYVERITGDAAEEELAFLIDAITTNLTKFFREDYQFKHLVSDVLKPRVADAAVGGPKTLRIWSAGCSGGQEPYTIAMVVASVIKDLENWDIKILATDIDRNMLAKGAAGEYSAEEVASLPASFRKRFARKLRSGRFEMHPTLKSLIHFKSLNLMDRWPFKHQFDVIYCRNVVIYFDDKTKKELVKGFCRVLKPEGYFYLGHSEALMGNVPELRSLGRSCFQKEGAT